MGSRGRRWGPRLAPPQPVPCPPPRVVEAHPGAHLLAQEQPPGGAGVEEKHTLPEGTSSWWRPPHPPWAPPSLADGGAEEHWVGPAPGGHGVMGAQAEKTSSPEPRKPGQLHFCRLLPLAVPTPASSCPRRAWGLPDHISRATKFLPGPTPCVTVRLCQTGPGVPRPPAPAGTRKLGLRPTAPKSRSPSR